MESLFTRLKRLLLGAPRDVFEQGVFHRLSLVPILAWVGLGADGLSSAAYGPEEAFRALGTHWYLAPFLALATAVTVFVIAASYNRLIELFPHGGGAYVVASKLLGPGAGVTAASSLLVDYVLTITISVAAGVDAVSSLLSPDLAYGKLPAMALLTVLLIVLNLRGLRESVLVLAPIFVAFLLTHVLLIGRAFVLHGARAPEIAHGVASGLSEGARDLGLFGLLALFFRAYSLGGGTYTGIEAVSNALPSLREPRVKNGKLTMLYTATSLAIAAGGIILAYLVMGIAPDEHRTMNASLSYAVFEHFGGNAMVWITMLAEGLLLFVAAQTGFISGPQVLSNMALDSWMPHRFSALSDRLTRHYGVLLMGGAALVMLLATGGDVHTLVILYSINVFVTFSLSQAGMARLTWQRREGDLRFRRHFALHAVAFLLCVSILLITLVEKFGVGGWLSVAIAGAIALCCLLIRHQYQLVLRGMEELDRMLLDLPLAAETAVGPSEPDPEQPTAVILVSGYNGLGIHTLLNVFRTFPGYYKNVVFVSVGVIDSGSFKGEASAEELRASTEAALERYVTLARRLGFPSACELSVGTEAVSEAVVLCRKVAARFPRAMFFGAKLLFRRDRWYELILHNQTAFQIQRQLLYDGLPMVVMAARVRADA